MLYLMKTENGVTHFVHRCTKYNKIELLIFIKKIKSVRFYCCNFLWKAFNEIKLEKYEGEKKKNKNVNSNGRR